MRTQQGDTFEELAYREYGSTQFAEALMNVNRDKIETQMFKAGVTLNDVTVESGLKVVKAPWQ